MLKDSSNKQTVRYRDSERERVMDTEGPQVCKDFGLSLSRLHPSYIISSLKSGIGGVGGSSRIAVSNKKGDGPRASLAYGLHQGLRIRLPKSKVDKISIFLFELIYYFFFNIILYCIWCVDVTRCMI